MEKIDGFGGFFFRASDPKALAQWYTDHFGILPTPRDYGGEPWRQTAGITVFQPFAGATRMWRADKAFMLNFRVSNLLALVHDLQAAGIAVKLDPKEYPNGWFAELEDPEGNPIQLWQPKEPQK